MRWKAFLAFATTATGMATGKCDSWMSPHQFESFSANSNFVAVVQPASKTNKAFVIVYNVIGVRRTQAWRASLSNSSAPLSVFLSDDGQYIVTLNNWGRAGYGDDVVVLYNSKGQLAKYALEEFAPPPQLRTNGLIERLKEKIESVRRGFSVPTSMLYDGLFDHSTSSRWWNRDSVEFFSPQTNATHFCLWLDWDQRWVAWKLSSGSLVEPSAKQAITWNAEGRRRSLKEIQSGKGSAAAYNFLGRLRVKEDRALIEAWLKDQEFGTGSRQSSSSHSATIQFALTASSYKRQTADRILTRWDGGTSLRRRSDDQNTFLGTVEGRLRLIASPEKDQGSLRILLVPESTPLWKWNAERPEQYLIAEVAHYQPTDFSNGRITRLPLGTNIDFIIYGVTPGSYRIQAHWDKEPPFCKSTNRLCEVSRGDFISTNSPSIKVRKGETSSRVEIDCITPVN